MNLKCLYCLICLLLLFSGLSAQSKNKTITNLKCKLDSLNKVLVDNRFESLSKNKTVDILIDSISKKNLLLKAELNKCVIDFEMKCEEFASVQKKNETLESELSLLKEENVKVKFKLNSIENARKEKKFSLSEMEMVFVEGGSFRMGSDFGNDDEKPIHNITLSSFYIGKYEVTQSQWEGVMNNNPSFHRGCGNCPVENVSWNDIQEYIIKLNSQTGLKYSLPTEAQWEYAAKGGVKSRGYAYSGSNDIHDVAWYFENSETLGHNDGEKPISFGRNTHAVREQNANELGIYDMTGNVNEWCTDWFGPYQSFSETNPSGLASGQFHVVRGGGWNDIEDICRNASRDWLSAFEKNSNCGFRLVLPVNP